MSFPPQIPSDPHHPPTSLTLCSSSLSPNKQTRKQKQIQKVHKKHKTKSKQMGKRLIGEKLSKQNKTKVHTIPSSFCILCCLTHGGWLPDHRLVVWQCTKMQPAQVVRWVSQAQKGRDGAGIPSE